MAVTMVYDLETIPDIASGRRLLNLPDAPSEAVAEALFARRELQTQGSSRFLPHHLQKVITISVVVATPEWVKVWSLGEPESSEHELLERFFEGIQRYKPNLVSWNGSGFDLPVLHYRSLLQGVSSARYWDNGERDQDFKWNNYLSRYHYRHLDLMDVLAGYQNRAFAPLDEIALMLGFPGKLTMQGSEVFEQYQRNNIQAIREYCEIDVLNTYLIFLRFQYIRGYLTDQGLHSEEERLKQYLLTTAKPHFLEFVQAWQSHPLT
jgi:predicted PolB exonuclease-like 3'-5' exonuclease